MHQEFHPGRSCGRHAAGLGLLAACLAAAAGPAGRAGQPARPAEALVEFLAPEQAIVVRGFPRHAPATLDDLLEADRRGGWNRVRHAPDTDTYTLDASLVIGGMSTWAPTYVQVGRPGHVRETARVKGFVWIRPPRAGLAWPDGRPGVVNRLTLGDPVNEAIRATLIIERPAAPRVPGLFMGYRPGAPGSERVCGGDLHVYNGAVLVQPPDSPAPPPAWVRGMDTECYCAEVRLVGATVSGLALYGVRADNSTLERTVFEHSPSVLSLGYQRAVECVFRNLGCPVSGDRIELIRCVFESNAVNWRLHADGPCCAEAIDCRMGEPRQPLELRNSTAGRATPWTSGAPAGPCYIERRSLAVCVEDPRGRPVAGAVVSLACPAEDAAGAGAGGAAHRAAVRNPVAVTDPRGCTPRKAEDGALLPAVRRLWATDDPAAPREETFAYRLTVEAAGFRRADRALGPTDLAAGTVTVSLAESR